MQDASHRKIVRALGDDELICHGDFGPWNVVWQGERPVGIFDWDYARPASRLYDVAYALEYVAPFRDDAECLRWLRHPEPADRHRRLELFATAYGLTSTASWTKSSPGAEPIVRGSAGP